MTRFIGYRHFALSVSPRKPYTSRTEGVAPIMDVPSNRRSGTRVSVVGLAILIVSLMTAGVASASTPADPPGGAAPLAPHFYNGNVEAIRGAGSDTTVFVMQKISDLFTGAGLYGCTLNTGSGVTLYNSN